MGDTLSNHEKARNFLNKTSLMGLNLFRLKFLPEDRVALIKVLDKEDTGRIQIPSFITEVDNDNIVFFECRYTEVYVDNRPNLPFNAKYLFSRIDSDRLKIRFAHPECITDTSYMFHESRFLSEIDFLGFSGVKPSRTTCMFSHCTALKYIDISGIDTSEVKDMRGMFEKCSSLKQLDLSNFNTCNASDMRSIFEYCISLESIDLRSFDTSKVIEMSNMFNYCIRLHKLDLSNFNFESVNRCERMLSNCGLDYLKLDTLDIIRLSSMLDSIKINMFKVSNTVSWNNSLITIKLNHPCSSEDISSLKALGIKII